MDASEIKKRPPANTQREKSEGQRSEVAAENEIVSGVAAMEINVHVVVDKYIVTRGEFAATFETTLGFRANLNRTLDDMSIEMANSPVARPISDGRSGRAHCTPRAHRATTLGTARRTTAAARSAERGKSEERYRQPDGKAQGDVAF